MLNIASLLILLLVHSPSRKMSFLVPPWPSVRACPSTMKGQSKGERKKCEREGKRKNEKESEQNGRKERQTSTINETLRHTHKEQQTIDCLYHG